MISILLLYKSYDKWFPKAEEARKITSGKVKPGLYMLIGYRTGTIILKFPPFCQLNEAYQERDNSK